ncbi:MULTISPECIES: pilus assembly protein TadG-related protein [unclassified Knoellia]|uniref:pilus assembly protein TadG-related protein n=1 Tax=Knoellia altitudinis TaxID=3404795 RepID=UPI003608AB13
MTRPTCRRRRDERGAVGVLVAMLFGFFVVTGLLAWSVDAGQIILERRQTQNAADAAALALAQSCAKTNCNLDADGLPALVNANTINIGTRTHTIERQCKSAASIPGSLPVCSSSPSVTELRECPPLPSSLSSGFPYVEVRVRANDTGPGLIPNLFTQVNSTGPDTSNVVSCARAAWGSPTSGAFTSPITISTCEWQTYTSGGTTYVAQPPAAPWPGYGGAGQPAYPLAATTPNSPGREVIIDLHDPAKPGCSYKGKDTAGGFGYLDTTGSCSTTLTTTNGVNIWANIDTGSSTTGGCQTALSNIWTSGPVIDLPVFDCMVKSTTGTPAGAPPADCDPSDAGGANTYYHVAGIAKFYLSGYRIGGGVTKASHVSGAIPCGNPRRCISGWFVQGVLNVPATTIVPPSSTTGFGLSAVVAAG